MNEYSKETGMRIRMFRRLKGFSQQEFADALHKTKSTVSKYERGDISIDLETFHEICCVLSLSPATLLPPSKEESDVGGRGQTKQLYLYNLAGRQGVLTRSLLEIYGSDTDQEASVSWFYGIPSFHAPEKCQGYYFGSITRQNIFTHLHLTNQKNSIEQVSICYRSNLDNLSFSVGLMSGLSFESLVPVTSKIIISAKPLAEDEVLLQALSFDQAEIKRMRTTGIMAVERR